MGRKGHEVKISAVHEKIGTTERATPAGEPGATQRGHPPAVPGVSFFRGFSEPQHHGDQVVLRLDTGSSYQQNCFIGGMCFYM